MLPIAAIVHSGSDITHHELMAPGIRAILEWIVKHRRLRGGELLRMKIGRYEVDNRRKRKPALDHLQRGGQHSFLAQRDSWVDARRTQRRQIRRNCRRRNQ
jgi:hypothetical protein